MVERKHPEVVWAQRSEEVYVTINITDVKNETIDIKDSHLSFEGVSEGNEGVYGFDVELYGEIDPEKSKKAVTPRHIVLVLAKKQMDAAWWPRLQKDSKRIPYIKTDFSRWRDEDEESEEDGGFGNMDFSALGGGGGGGGGMDFSSFQDDSEDEDDEDMIEAGGAPEASKSGEDHAHDHDEHDHTEEEK